MRSLAAAVSIPVLALALAAPAAAEEKAPAPKAPTLYSRLGGYDAIAAVSDDFIVRLVGDPRLGQFFVGHGDKSRQRIRQLIVDQLCAVTGGPCVYVGREMKEVHAGLGITSQDWDAMVKHLVASLEKFKVPSREKDDLLAALGTLKKDIVEKP